MRVLKEYTLIKAPRRAVWAALADFGNVHAWAPNMKWCQLNGQRSSGVGTRRRMRHAWGFVFDEVVTDWQEGEGFSFNVLSAPFPMTRVQESWIIDGDDEITRVATEVRYDMHLGPLGRLLDGQLVRFIVRREMRGGLRGLAGYVERTGEPRLSTN